MHVHSIKSQTCPKYTLAGQNAGLTGVQLLVLSDHVNLLHHMSYCGRIDITSCRASKRKRKQDSPDYDGAELTKEEKKERAAQERQRKKNEEKERKEQEKEQKKLQK